MTATISFAALAVFFVLTPLQQVNAQSTPTVTFSSGSDQVAQVSREQLSLFVSQAIKRKRIFSLIAMVKRIEKQNGGKVLDAELITPIPLRYKSWYYVIKHRAANGYVSVRRYSAHTGKVLK